MKNSFNIIKTNGSIHVHMLTFEEMWKKSQTHSNINMRFWIVTCVSINCGKCKIQPMNNAFNILKMYGSTHVLCW
jgi:hypothetical protein